MYKTIGIDVAKLRISCYVKFDVHLSNICYVKVGLLQKKA